MKPTVLLRTASILTLIHCILHTVGGVFGAPTNPDEVAVIAAMKSHRFAVMGSMRTFWDFYFGYGLFVSLSLLALAVLFWQLATLAKSRAPIGSIVAVFSLCYLAFALVAANYFFIAPAVFEVIIALCLALAFFTLRKQP